MDYLCSPIVDELLLDFLSNAPVCLHILDSNGTIVWANKTELDLLGYNESEYVGRDMRELHFDESIGNNLLQMLLKGQVVHQMIAPWKTKSGRIVWVEISSNIRYVSGVLTTTRCYSVNITAKMEQNILLSSKLQKEARRTKTVQDFSDHICHEIRNSLHGIKSAHQVIAKNLDLMRTTLSSTPETAARSGDLLGELEECMAVIQESTKSQDEIVNQVLECHRIESDVFQLAPYPFSLREIIVSVLTMSKFDATAKGVTLVSEFSSSGLMLVYGDGARLKQIILNLVGNAVKFTEFGKVTVSVKKTNKGAYSQFQIQVIDEGMGMTEEQRKKLFRKFQQADQSTSRHFGGSGLGLHISAKLISLMEGEISVNSSLNHGTTFTIHISFPKCCPEQKQEFRNSSPNAPQPKLLPQPITALTPHQPLSWPHRAMTLSGHVQAEVLDYLLNKNYNITIVHRFSDIKSSLGLSSTPNSIQFLILDLEKAESGNFAFRKLSHLKNVVKIAISPDIHLRYQFDQLGVDALLTKADGARLQCLFNCVRPDLTHTSSCTRVLLVDDNQVVRKALRATLSLRNKNVTCHEASNGTEALFLFECIKYDCVFTDLQMQGMSGEELTSRIRDFETSHGFPRVPIICVTGSRTIDNYKEIGIDAVLIKPFTSRHLQDLDLPFLLGNNISNNFPPCLNNSENSTPCIDSLKKSYSSDAITISITRRALKIGSYFFIGLILVAYLGQYIFARINVL